MTDIDKTIKKKGIPPPPLEDMVSLYGKRLLRSAFLLCGKESDAQDLVQETFYQAIKSRSRFRGESQVFTWLYGILLNVFRQYIRKQKKQLVPAHLLSDEQMDDEEVENRFDINNVYARVNESMKSLSRKHREVLVLRYLEELKITEIANILNCSIGTIKSRLFYAIHELRYILPQNLNLFSGEGTNNKDKK